MKKLRNRHETEMKRADKLTVVHERQDKKGFGE
jgi:hypothetical protein